MCLVIRGQSVGLFGVFDPAFLILMGGAGWVKSWVMLKLVKRPKSFGFNTLQFELDIRFQICYDFSNRFWGTFLRGDIAEPRLYECPKGH